MILGGRARKISERYTKLCRIIHSVFAGAAGASSFCVWKSQRVMIETKGGRLRDQNLETVCNLLCKNRRVRLYVRSYTAINKRFDMGRKLTGREIAGLGW